MALLILASEYEGGSFRAQVRQRIREALRRSGVQDTECRIERKVSQSQRVKGYFCQHSGGAGDGDGGSWRPA